MPKSRTPRALDPAFRRRVIVFVRAYHRWSAEIDREARWLASLDGRDQAQPDDRIQAIRRLRARGIEMPDPGPGGPEAQVRRSPGSAIHP